MGDTVVATKIISGKVVGRSEFDNGGISYMIEYELPNGKSRREWVDADILARGDFDEI